MSAKQHLSLSKMKYFVVALWSIMEDTQLLDSSKLHITWTFMNYCIHYFKCIVPSFSHW